MQILFKANALILFNFSSFSLLNCDIPANVCNCLTLKATQTVITGNSSSSSSCTSSILINNCPTPTKAPTCTATRTATASPTRTATPRPTCTNVPNNPPSCDAGGPYEGLECSTTPVSVRLDGSKSSDPADTELSYRWDSNCSGFQFDNIYSESPVITLPTIPQDPSASSLNCTVYLMVTNGLHQISTCSAALSTKICNKDCAGTINGKSQIDICGICGGDGKSCLDCAGSPFGSLKFDVCGTCGGTATDPNMCNTIQCVTVEATNEILKYEKRLIKQAKTLIKKFNEENKRNKKNKCGIDTTESKENIDSAYETIKKSGVDIFTQGVEICGNDCITVSYADQVLELKPKFKVLEFETNTLAKKVQDCYKRKNIKRDQKIPGVKTTIKLVETELTKLIKDCQDQQVCP